MKKLVLSAILLSSFAAVHGQLSIAPEAGLNFANMRAGIQTNLPKGGIVHTTMRTGVAIGVIADYRIISRLSIQSGVFYLTNGCKVTGGGYVAINTIQVPIYIQYGKNTGGPDFFAGLGPFLGINLGYQEKIGGGSVTSYPIGNDTASALKAVDVGLGINAGIRFTRLYFRLRAQSGFVNLQPGGDVYNFARTSSLGVSAGYYIFRLGKKAKK